MSNDVPEDCMNPDYDRQIIFLRRCGTSSWKWVSFVLKEWVFMSWLRILPPKKKGRTKSMTSNKLYYNCLLH